MIFALSFCFMDTFTSPTPVSITAYCSAFGFTFDQVRIPCKFCKSYLTVQDCAAFDLKKFKLLWKDGFCYGCCRSCMRLSAAFESSKFKQCVCSCYFVVDLVEKPLREIPMRCIECLAFLDYSEKLQHLHLNENFSLVRGNWRGYCRNCIRKE